MPDTPNLRDKLRAIAAAYGHVHPDLHVPGSFVPAATSSSLMILRDYFRTDTRQHVCDVLCKCGRRLYRLSYSRVVRGIVRSCGCNELSRRRAKDRLRAQYAHPRQLGRYNRVDRLGEEHGYLKVTDHIFVKSYADLPPDSYPRAQKFPVDGFFWVLTCACGNKMYLTSRAIRYTLLRHCTSSVCTQLFRQDYPKNKVMWYINLNFAGRVPKKRKTSAK